MTRAETVLSLAKASGATITTAESCTGGMVGAAITDIAGSSSVFERGFITYSNAAKAEMLGVPAALLDQYGAVSEEVAIAMANGALAAARADYAVAITGIAGPGGSDFKPEGRVCFAVASAISTSASTVEFGTLGRGNVRAAARDHAFDLLISELSNNSS